MNYETDLNQLSFRELTHRLKVLSNLLEISCTQSDVKQAVNIVLNIRKEIDAIMLVSELSVPVNNSSVVD